MLPVWHNEIAESGKPRQEGHHRRNVQREYGALLKPQLRRRVFINIAKLQSEDRVHGGVSSNHHLHHQGHPAVRGDYLRLPVQRRCSREIGV